MSLITVVSRYVDGEVSPELLFQLQCILKLFVLWNIYRSIMLPNYVLSHSSFR